MLHCRDGIGQVMSGAWFPPDMPLAIQAKEINLCFTMVCAFYWGVVSVWPFYHTGLVGGVLQRLLFFWKVVLPPQRNAGALSEWPSGSWSPPCLRPFSPECSVWLGGLFQEESWWFQTYSIYEWWRPLCSLGPSMLQKWFCSLPQICTLIQSGLRGLQTIPWTSWLGLCCSDMHCWLWDLT